MNGKLLFLLFINCLQASAQQSSINGVVSIFNSKTRTGILRFVSLAQVEDEFNKAQPAVTNEIGQFSLIYVGIADSTPVSLLVKKPGLQVVNTDKLSTTIGQNSLIKINMAHPDSISEYRRQIYNVGKTEAEKNLENLVVKKNKELTSLRKNSLQNKNRINGLEQEISQLEDRRKKIEEQAQDLARRYAPVNLDDASSLFSEAFQLFQKGSLDSAQLLLKQADLAGKVKSVKLEEKKLGQMKKEIRERDSVKDQRKTELEDALQLKADLHKTHYEFDSVSTCYELMIELDSLNTKCLFDYALFLKWLNQYDKAIKYYIKDLTVLKNNPNNIPLAHELEIAISQSDLGYLYWKKNDYVKAEAAYLEALKINKHLAGTNQQTYEPYVGNTQNGLGLLYNAKNDFAKAEAAWMQALEIYRRFASINPQTYEPEVAKVQNNLGILYYNINDYAKAENAYLTALEIRKRLSKLSPQTYEPDVAISQSNLGVLYSYMNDFAKAEVALLEALEIHKRLAAANPQTYEPEVAGTQTNLGILYEYKKDYVKAETAYLEALEINKRLAIINPQTYEPAIAGTQTNLGAFYNTTKDYVKAETAEQEALEIYRRFAMTNPQTFEPDVAMMLNNLGNLYINMNDFVKAEVALLGALKIRKRLVMADPETFEPGVAITQDNLGIVYFNKKDYVKAELAFLEALKIRKRFARIEPGTFEPYLATTQANLGVLYNKINNYLKAEAALLEALEIFKRFAKSSPESFEPDVANVQNNLGLVYFNKNSYIKAETAYLEALEILKQWMNISPGLYTKEMNEASINFLNLYTKILDSFKVDAFKKSKQDKFESVETVLFQQSKKDREVAQKLSTYYGKRSLYLLFASKFKEAEQAAKKGLETDSTQIWIKANLAHALLLKNDYEKALIVYKALKSMKDKQGKSYAAVCIEDLKELEKNGVTNNDVTKIRMFLKE